MTRVSFVGDKTIIVAGPVPPHIAVRGLTEKVEAELAGTGPGTLKHPDKQPSKPPKFIAPAKPEAKPAPAVKKGK